MVTIPFTNIAKEAEYICQNTNFNELLNKLILSGNYVCGQYVKEFEDAIVKRLQKYSSQSLYCVGVNSGTTALQLCIQYRGGNKSVSTTATTFWATTEAIYNAGYTPDFHDINLNTLQITPRNYSIVVALHGRPISKYKSVAVIEDNCQCGPEHFNDNCFASCYSLFPSKPLGSCGDGGFVVTPFIDLAEWLIKARYHGLDFTKNKYDANMVSSTFRLNEITALFALKRLEVYDILQTNRCNYAFSYCANLDIPFNENHYYHIFNIFVRDREEVKKKLKEIGADWGWHYPVSCVNQLEKCSYTSWFLDMPNTEWFTQHCLSLPLHPFMELEQIHKICEIVKPYLIKTGE